MLIRVLLSFLNRNINIIVDHWINGNPELVLVTRPSDMGTGKPGVRVTWLKPTHLGLQHPQAFACSDRAQFIA